MKRRFLLSLLTVLVASALLFSFASCSKDDDEDDIDWSKVTLATSSDDEVINCFNAINAFRTSNTWQYKSDGTKEDITGRSAFVISEDLCRVAQLRAKELLKNFSHTRPNGKGCFTAFNDAGVSLSPRGECIAAGYSTGVSVTNGWWEENENYNGQGHRRILLAGDATKVGIAYVYYPDSKYKYYWALVTAN